MCVDVKWYVMQVMTGKEQDVIDECRLKLPERLLETMFIPCREEQRKRNGKWMTFRRVLFPGYVFISTDNIDEVFLNLKNVEHFTRILRVGDEMVPLTEEEKGFILRFCGDDMLAEMSRGIIVDSRVKVLDGPMMGMEAYIVKVDRHKRKAWLEMEMFGRIQRIQVGMEITMKVMDDPDAA